MSHDDIVILHTLTGVELLATIKRCLGLMATECFGGEKFYLLMTTKQWAEVEALNPEMRQDIFYANNNYPTEKDYHA